MDTKKFYVIEFDGKKELCEAQYMSNHPEYDISDFSSSKEYTKVMKNFYSEAIKKLYKKLKKSLKRAKRKDEIDNEEKRKLMNILKQYNNDWNEIIRGVEYSFGEASIRRNISVVNHTVSLLVKEIGELIKDYFNDNMDAKRNMTKDEYKKWHRRFRSFGKSGRGAAIEIEKMLER